MQKYLCHRIYARPLRLHTTIIESAGDTCALRRSVGNDINDITLVLECAIVDIVFSTPYDLYQWAISVISI